MRRGAPYACACPAWRWRVESRSLFKSRKGRTMAGVLDTGEFRKGLKIEIDGEPFEIIEFQHVKPGKGSAFVRTTYKSLISGRVLEKNFKSGDKVGRPDIEEKEMQFLYKQGDEF